jgi:hypothetical protein
MTGAGGRNSVSGSIISAKHEVFPPLRPPYHLSYDFAIMMSGPVLVTEAAGGKLVIETEYRTRILTIDNTGPEMAFLKLDDSEVELTADNGKPIEPGGSLVLGFGAAPNAIGPEMELTVRAITASGLETTLRAQTIPR